MIVYGWNSRVLKEAPFPGHRCSNCDSENCHIVVSSSYFHVFWIPLFPYRKKLRIVCGSCGHEEKAKNASLEVKQVAKQLKATVKTPFWMYAGSIIVALGISWLIIQGFMDSQRDLDMIDSPEVNDIYYLYDKDEPTEYKYYLYKVVEVNGDTVGISPNDYHYNRRPFSLEEEDGFYDAFFNIHKDDIKQLYEDDVIRDVQRGFAEGLGFERVLVFPDSLLENQ